MTALRVAFAVLGLWFLLSFALTLLWVGYVTFHRAMVGRRH